MIRTDPTLLMLRQIGIEADEVADHTGLPLGWVRRVMNPYNGYHLNWPNKMVESVVQLFYDRLRNWRERYAQLKMECGREAERERRMIKARLDLATSRQWHFDDCSRAAMRREEARAS